MARTAKKPSPRTDADEELEAPLTTEDRKVELSEDDDVHADLLELYTDIERGFESQNDRTNEQMDYWDIYHCRLSAKQYYSGNSKIFVPIVHDAIEARVTWFTNQIFPQNGRYLDVTTMDGEIPHGEMSLLTHYIKKAKLRTVVLPALLRNGDIEGQYNVYVEWRERKRHIAYRKPRPELAAADGVAVDDITEEIVNEGRPSVEVLADSDILVLPPTADTLGDALDAGGS